MYLSTLNENPRLDFKFCLPSARENGSLRRRIVFKTKTSICMWKCIHGVASVCLQELCVPMENVRCRSPFLGLDY